MRQKLEMKIPRWKNSFPECLLTKSSVVNFIQRFSQNENVKIIFDFSANKNNSYDMPKQNEANIFENMISNDVSFEDFI